MIHVRCKGLIFYSPAGLGESEDCSPTLGLNADKLIRVLDYHSQIQNRQHSVILTFRYNGFFCL